MLEAKSVAVVGASARPGSFGQRVLLEIERSPSRPEIHLVNPRYSGGGLDGRECLASLEDLPEPVDLVLMGVGDQAIEQQISLAAARGDRSAVIFGNVADPPGLRARVAAIAREGEMAVCGGGCMGFVNVAAGILGMALGWFLLPRSSHLADREPVDWLGNGYFTATISGLGSMPVTWRPCRMRSWVAIPVPTPTSSTGSPSPSPATSTSWSTSATG
jgi:hypothetical protein